MQSGTFARKPQGRKTKHLFLMMKQGGVGLLPRHFETLIERKTVLGHVRIQVFGFNNKPRYFSVYRFVWGRRGLRTRTLRFLGFFIDGGLPSRHVSYLNWVWYAPALSNYIEFDMHPHFLNSPQQRTTMITDNRDRVPFISKTTLLNLFQYSKSPKKIER